MAIIGAFQVHDLSSILSTRTKLIQREAMKQNTIILGLILVVLAMVMALLAMTGEVQRARDAEAKQSAALYKSELKAEYFEWREQNSLGHTVDKSKFPRYAEFEKLQ
jgi:Mn2+/Fe2+ NRAMP family transporter